VRDYAPNLPRIEVRASELNQVWTNLVDNALDAMGDRGRLVLRTYAGPGTWSWRSSTMARASARGPRPHL